MAKRNKGRDVSLTCLVYEGEVVGIGEVCFFLFDAIIIKKNKECIVNFYYYREREKMKLYNCMIYTMVAFI